MEITNINEQKYYENYIFPLTYEYKYDNVNKVTGTILNIESNISSSNFNSSIDSNNNNEIDKIIDWLSNNNKAIDDLLLLHKAILFRTKGVIKNHEDFHRFVISSNYTSMSYLGGAAVRTQLTERVFTANESPSSEIIPFHHEMAQTPSPPTHLFFYCEIPPQQGGETPILISCELYDRMTALHPQLMRDIETYGVQYIRYMPEDDDPTSAIGRGWKSTYLANDRETVEKALLSLGSTWEWQEDGTLKTITAIVPGVRTDNQPEGVLRTNRKTFFNSIVAAYVGWNDSRNDGKKAVRLAIPKYHHDQDNISIHDHDHVHNDDINNRTSSIKEIESMNGEEQQQRSYLDPIAMEDAVRIMKEICISFTWQYGDILLLDNRTVMHSRNPFVGPRRILASLARDPLR